MSLLGTKLKELRENRGKSVQKVVNDLQCAGLRKDMDKYVFRKTFSQWETGEKNPNLTDLVALCDYFNVPADYLLGRDAPQFDDNIIADASTALGISENAVKNIMIIASKGDSSSDMFDRLIGSDLFVDLIKTIVHSRNRIDSAVKAVKDSNNIKVIEHHAMIAKAYLILSEEKASDLLCELLQFYRFDKLMYDAKDGDPNAE